jgi:hypothetical protein
MGNPVQAAILEFEARRRRPFDTKGRVAVARVK